MSAPELRQDERFSMWEEHYLDDAGLLDRLTIAQQEFEQYMLYPSAFAASDASGYRSPVTTTHLHSAVPGGEREDQRLVDGPDEDSDGGPASSATHAVLGVGIVGSLNAPRAETKTSLGGDEPQPSSQRCFANFTRGAGAFRNAFLTDLRKVCRFFRACRDELSVQLQKAQVAACSGRSTPLNTAANDSHMELSADEKHPADSQVSVVCPEDSQNSQGVRVEMDTLERKHDDERLHAGPDSDGHDAALYALVPSASVKADLKTLFRHWNFLKTYAFQNFEGYVRVLEQIRTLCTILADPQSVSRTNTSTHHPGVRGYAYFGVQEDDNSGASGDGSTSHASDSASSDAPRDLEEPEGRTVRFTWGHIVEELSQALDESSIAATGAASVDGCIDRTVAVYAAAYTASGSHAEARDLLLAKEMRDTINWADFRTGLRFGVLLILVCWGVWIWAVDHGVRPHDVDKDFIHVVQPGFRAVGLCLMLGWLLVSVSVVWAHFRINFRYVFQLPAFVKTDPLPCYKSLTSLTSWFMVAYIFSYKVARGDFPDFIPAGAYSLMLMAYMTYRMIFPLRNLRFWVWEVMKVVISPFAPVSFLGSYIGDVMTSFVKVANDIGYSVCYVGAGLWLDKFDPDDNGKGKNGNATAEYDVCSDSSFVKDVLIPCFAALPLWFRFLQNMRRYRDTYKRFPFLANGLKYAVAQTVILFALLHKGLDDPSDHSTYTYLWVTSYIISTLYTFSWDVYMDWGLGDLKHGFLRPRESLMYRWRWPYYTAIGLDLILRFTWTATLVPKGAGNPISKEWMEWLNPALAALELFRRSMWSVFRVENEHLHNTSGFRRFGYVPLLFESPTAAEKDRAAREERSEVRPWRVVLEVIVFLALVLTAVLVAIGTKG